MQDDTTNQEEEARRNGKAEQGIEIKEARQDGTTKQFGEARRPDKAG
jgi:hypothetical protein